MCTVCTYDTITSLIGRNGVIWWRLWINGKNDWCINVVKRITDSVLLVISVHVNEKINKEINIYRKLKLIQSWNRICFFLSFHLLFAAHSPSHPISLSPLLSLSLFLLQYLQQHECEWTRALVFEICIVYHKRATNIRHRILEVKYCKIENPVIRRGPKLVRTRNEKLNDKSRFRCYGCREIENL